MNKCKFKQLILNMYKEWGSPKRRRYVHGDIGCSVCTNFSGTFYGKDMLGSFKDIKNAEEYMDIVDHINMCNPEMLLLKSRTTNQEVGICKFQFDNYIIDGDILIIEFEDKKIIFQM